MAVRGLRAVPLLLVLLAGLQAPAVPAAAQDTGVDEQPVEVVVDRLLPRAPVRGDEPFQVTGTLVNRGDEPLRGLQVRLLVDAVLRTRGALARADADPALGSQRGELVAAADPELLPGERTTFDVRLPVSALGLSRLGVYPLAVQVRGQVGEDARRSPVGLATTFVPWFPGGPPARTRVAVVWPLVDVPRQGPDGAVLDEALLDLVRPGTPSRPAGRLSALLQAARTAAPGACDGTAGPVDGVPVPPPVDPAEPPVPEPPCRAEPVPVTYAADPDLLAALDATTRPYAVRDGAELLPRPPSAEAAAWLEELRAALDGGSDLLALPYADPDVVALTRPRTGLQDDVEVLRRLGDRTAAELTGVEPLATVALPPPGPLPPAAVEATADGDVRAVVLDEAALSRPLSRTGRTPGARTALSSAAGGALSGLVVEGELSRLLEVDAGDVGWQGPRLAEQRFLAETAMIAAERPGESRTLVVAPSRRAEVDPATASAALLDLGRLPWLCPVRLADVATGEEACAGEAATDREPVEEDRGELASPDPRGRGLSPEVLERIADTRVAADQLTDEVLEPNEPGTTETKARLLRARARAESSAWRDAPREGRRVLDLYADEVDALRDRVRVQTSGRVTLTSTTGTVIVTVVNELDAPVSVGVDLNDPLEARLSSTSTETRVVPGRQAVQVPVRVEARTSGQFVVRATLLDRSGTPFGEPVELVVRSTGYGKAALAVTGVGAGLLLLAAGVRIVRRALRRPA